MPARAETEPGIPVAAEDGESLDVTRAPESETAKAPPGRTGGEASPGSATRARAMLELVALVAAPTTLITALAFYFGWKLTEARAAYFGIDHSTLGFSTQDYLLRSADALFVPLGVIVVAALVALALHTLVLDLLLEERGLAALRRVAAVAAALGLALFGLGAYGVFRELPFSAHYLFVPLSPGLGMAVLAYAVYVLRRLAPTSSPEAAARRARGGIGRPGSLGLVLVVLLVVLSLFWTMSEYAGALGRGRAAQLEASLSSRPGATVFTGERLQLAAPGVTETRLSGADSAFRFRYDGLRLLIRSDGKYFLLPDGWSRERGVAVVLPDDDRLRIEFTP